MVKNKTAVLKEVLTFLNISRLIGQNKETLEDFTSFKR